MIDQHSTMRVPWKSEPRIIRVELTRTAMVRESVKELEEGWLVTRFNPPAPRPCASCPYRRDVPSGVWAPEEYEKLRKYDRPTGDQPPAVFLCHQQDRDSASRVCGGWAGCHDGDELLALRVAVLTGQMTPDEAYAVTDYASPVKLFASGSEAANHGLAEVNQPGEPANRVIRKIERVRTDLRRRGE